MSREIDTSKKLTKADIKYLKSRHTNEYVERMIELSGTKVEKDEEPAPTPDPAEGDPNAGDSTVGAGDGNEDLLGEAFSPLDKTEKEISEHFAGFEGDALDAEKQRVFDIESAREDREPRKGVLAL